MNFSNGHAIALALALGVLSAGSSIAACSSSKSDNNGGGFGDDSGGGGDDASGSVGTQPGSCSNPTVEIVFAPMFSAYIPGSTAQTFQIPAVTADGNTATWSLSDPTQAHMQVQSFTSGAVTTPGVMITIAGTGNSQNQITVYATESGGACGASVLTITQNTETDWTIGNARYNDGVSLHLGAPAGGGGGGRPEGGMPVRGGFPGADAGSFYEQDGGTACTNCHGPTAADGGPYRDVSHTPEQTGGFSDMDLQNIIWNGEVPDGGYFDPTVLIPTCDGGATCTAAAYAMWHRFHQWTDITSDQLPGVICYLRALTPEGQNGTSNFGGGGGRRPGDGGGGGRRPDGGYGGGGRRDAGTVSDAGAVNGNAGDGDVGDGDVGDAAVGDN